MADPVTIRGEKRPVSPSFSGFPGYWGAMLSAVPEVCSRRRSTSVGVIEVWCLGIADPAICGRFSALLGLIFRCERAKRCQVK